MEYKVKNVHVHKGIKIFVGNYETVNLQYGMEVEPTSDILNEADLDVFMTLVSKDIDDIIKPQADRIREWAKHRFDK